MLCARLQSYSVCACERCFEGTGCWTAPYSHRNTASGVLNGTVSAFLKSEVSYLVQGDYKEVDASYQVKYFPLKLPEDYQLQTLTGTETDE